MATCALCRRVPRLSYLQGLKRYFTEVQHLSGKPEDETNEHEERNGADQHQETSLQDGYRLYYSPSSYHCSVQNSSASRNKSDNDEHQLCLSTPTASSWQQSSRYSVNFSRHFSCTKNTLLDFAFNKDSEPEMPAVSAHLRKDTPPEVKVDTRAFLKCRSEYASTSLDLAQRPHPIQCDEAFSILQKVVYLKASMKPSDVSQFLAELSRLHPDKVPLVRNDQRFIMLLRYSVEQLHHFSDLQLLQVLQSFVWLDMPSAHSVLGLYEAELSCRAKQMSLHQMLLAADMWRCIGRQVPQFLEKLYDSVHLCLGQIGVSELVQLVYIIGESRKCPAHLIHSIEQLLMRHLNQLHPEEVGTVCLGLFKCQTPISTDAVTHIVDKAHYLLKEMSDFAIVNVMKYLRFSYLFHREWMEAVAEEFPHRVNSMAVQGLMHVSLTCSALHYRNDNILSAVADRVPSLVPHCRIKDSCKLLWAFGTLGFIPVQSSNFYSSLTESLRQNKNAFQRYPEHLLTGLLGLAFVSQFPEDLIALALSPEFVNLAMKTTQMELKKDLFTLDGAVALELPHWTGPRLSFEMKQEVTDMLWRFAQSDVCQKPEVQEAESALQSLLGGEEFVCKRMILPHTRSIDLEVHLDSAGQPTPVYPASHKSTLSTENSSSKVIADQGWGKEYMGVNITEELLEQLIHTKKTTEPLTLSSTVEPPSLQRVEPDEGRRLFDTGLHLTSEIIESLNKPRIQNSAPQDSKGIVKLAIQVTNRNHYCYQSQQLLGFHAMKRRHLNLAGYTVVELNYQEWFPLLRRSRSEKLAYLHCKVFNTLKY